MDSDERALLEAAALEAAEIPYRFIFVWKDGDLVEVNVAAQKAD